MFLCLCIDHFIPLQFDMQQLSLDELKQVLFHAFRDHLTMKDIESIIITEEESLNETSGNCPEYEGGEEAALRESFGPLMNTWKVSHGKYCALLLLLLFYKVNTKGLKHLLSIYMIIK